MHETGLRVTLLGTGSPSPSLVRSQPACLVRWGPAGSVLVDAGDGLVAQLLRAEVDLRQLGHVLLTHLHWDHILGYPALVWGGWNMGRSALAVWGPVGTEDMHRQLVGDFYRDQAQWAMDLGFDPAGWKQIVVQDIEPGWSTVLHGCRIEAAAVVHPPMASVAYRFTFEGRSLVVSGDTAACEELVAFSAGADLLLVDACAAPAPASSSPARRALIERLPRYHASPQACVDMARRAGVATVVLTHLLPGVTPEVDSSGFDGRLAVGADLETYIV